MKILSVKNFKKVINNCTFRKGIKSTSNSNVLLPNISHPKIPTVDVFQKQDYGQLLSGVKNDSVKKDIAESFLRKNPINKENYSKLSAEELLAIRAQLTPDLIYDADIVVKTSKILKSLFDKKYGEGKYIVVSIGRSLSILTKCLEFMGIETRQIPISGCNKGEPNKILNKMVGAQQYKTFLEEIFKNSRKKRIFCDFAATGKTLKVFKDFLNHPKIKLGAKNDKYIGINQFLENSECFKNDEFREVIETFNRMLTWQLFDKYSEVKKLPFNELRKYYLAVNNKDSEQNKLMKFCMMEMLEISKL